MDPNHHQGLSSGPPQMHHQQSADVLVEARRNLQALLDSGFTKEMLHQWVEESQAMQQVLQAPGSLAPPSTTPGNASPQALSPQPPNLAIPLHASPPQCPPPPVPTINTTTPTSPSSGLELASANAMTPGSVAGTSTATSPEDTSGSTAWQHPSVNTIVSPGLMSNMSEADAALFVPPHAPFNHRPRISVSSTSSGSSGHASIWSNHSAQSAMSWQSASSLGSRCQMGLTSPHGASPTSAAPVFSTPNLPVAGKHNIYWCTSCETSFKRKYDWKRHEDEFHERWRKYPCPEPGCNRSFWGSNSFNQHHKQCHGCKTCPHAEKVVKFLRKRKYWACGFCGALHPSRERHVEHVARHFEAGQSKGDWMHSRVVYGLLHQPLIHEAWDTFVANKQSEYNGRRPQFSWHPSKTGRAQGFLENESPGQLQDLLEFFSGDQAEAQWIVQEAYNRADIVLTSHAQPQFADSAMPATLPHLQHAASQVPFQVPQSAPQQFMPLMQQQPQQQLLPSQGHGSMFGGPQAVSGGYIPPHTFASTPPQKPLPGTHGHSPLPSSHSPLSLHKSPSVKRDQPLPPPPSEGSDGLMDFEYSPVQVVFEDWESMAGNLGDDSPTQQHPQQQHQQQQQQQQNWSGVMQFFDSRVMS